MYTVVNPSEKASCLKKYTKKQITVIDQEVNAWVLNEEEGLYLLYAMNWNGDTNLYCYDDNEKCFQRYIAEDDVNTQIEAANKAYNNVKNKYNTLVSKYNMLLKIACGLVIVIIIPFISILLVLADFVYFYALSYEDSMISIISLVRRSGVVVSFIAGAIWFKERNLKAKFIDLLLVLAGMYLIYLGTR